MSRLEEIGMIGTELLRTIPRIIVALFDKFTCGKPLAKHADDNLCYRYILYRRRFGSRGREITFLLGNRTLTAHEFDIVHSDYKGDPSFPYTPLFRDNLIDTLRTGPIGYGEDVSWDEPFWEKESVQGAIYVSAVALIGSYLIKRLLRKAHEYSKSARKRF